MNEEWETIAVGPASNDEWETVAIGAAAEPSFLDNITRALSRGSASNLFGPAMDAASFFTGQPVAAFLTNKLLGKEEVAPNLPGSAFADFVKERVPEVQTNSSLAQMGYSAAETAPSALLGPASISGTVGSFLAGPGGVIAEKLGLPKEAGQILGALSPAGARAAVSPFLAIKNALLPNLAGQADDAARQALEAAGTSPQKIAAKLATAKPITNPALMRTAEIAQDPGLALTTKALELRVPEAGAAARAIDARRAENQLLTILSKQGPVKSPEVTGKILREGLEEGAEVAKKSVRKAYEDLRGLPGFVTTAKAKSALTDFIKEEGAENIAAPALSRVQAFFNKKVNLSIDDFVELQKRFASTAAAYGKAVKSGSAGANAPEVAAGFRLMSKASSVLDDALEEAISKGKIAKNAAEKLSTAKALKKTQAQLFQRDAVGDIMQKTFGDYDVLNSQVVGKVLNTPEEARQAFRGLQKAVSKGPRSKEALRSAMIEDIKARSTSATTGEFMPASFSRTWRNMRVVAKEVLSPEQIKAINSVRADLISRQNLDRLARSASGGGSQTAELLGVGGHILAALSGRAVGSMTRRLPILGDIVEGISTTRAAKVKKMAEKILIDISFDPQFAKEFAAKPTAKNVESVFKEMLKRGLLTSTALSMGNRENMDEKKTPAPQELAAQPATTPQSAATPALSEKLVRAMIRQESSNNPKAVSKKGARGLMQLMPETAKEVAAELGIKNPDLEDPETNVRLGSHYMQKQLDRFGDVKLALAAYNAGPTRVAKWIELYGNDWDQIASAIKRVRPDHETLGYVKNILRYYEA